MSGGDSFSDIYGLERLLYVSLPQILALLMGKKLILLPQTIGPFRGRFSKSIARFILRRAERIYSRDYQGTKEVRNLLGRSQPPDRVRFCYDVGFVLDPVAPATLEITGLPLAGDRRSPVVGLNVSGLLYGREYSRDNMFGLRVDYKKFIFGLIDFLITKRNASVLLVPHVFGASPESDQPVCAEVFSNLRDTYPGRLELLQGTYNQHEIKYVIGRCDFFIGSRMHACIAAISQCLPTVCVAYSDKFVGVMETLGIDSIVADARRMSEMEIYRTIASVFDDRDAIRRQLEREIPRVKASVLDLFQRGPNLEAMPVSTTVP
jgi:polysaccharide pyruvyl transferase WcaK-like protein